VIFPRKYGSVNEDRRSMTGNVITAKSYRTAYWAENNPLCSLGKQPGIRNFPYSHTLWFSCTVKILPEGFDTWPIQH